MRTTPFFLILIVALFFTGAGKTITIGDKSFIAEPTETVIPLGKKITERDICSSWEHPSIFMLERTCVSSISVKNNNGVLFVNEEGEHQETIVNTTRITAIIAIIGSILMLLPPLIRSPVAAFTLTTAIIAITIVAGCAAAVDAAVVNAVVLFSSMAVSVIIIALVKIVTFGDPSNTVRNIAAIIYIALMTVLFAIV